METTQQLTVTDRSWAAVGHRVDVIDLAPNRGKLAAGHLTYPVAQFDGFSKTSRLLRGLDKRLVIGVDVDTGQRASTRTGGAPGHLDEGVLHPLRVSAPKIAHAGIVAKALAGLGPIVLQQHGADPFEFGIDDFAAYGTKPPVGPKGAIEGWREMKLGPLVDLLCRLPNSRKLR